ncbi:Crp/Fnr family transcriptional regulator [Halarsenatibacter silvermanii]|uniref:CRP/FNR family transcriptional regulator, anaerobic regulatory protein n=1 Tax=Halarsenatibacter silvermanii TaxID=321763 RepID=A0A1G9JKB9_9FIRM|nr:Crp/Fnr family transcriptional regulator [Halarsenatibacter silvermanii]SDL37969.1 CRP/FNR family transcriptional regulator, anaerobic regulatory protein [Halarsenatibacter silvermanii]
MTSPNKQLLKKVDLFSSMEEKQIEELSDLLEFHSFSEGEAIFRAGEKGRKMYLLKSGRVKIIKISPDGKEQIIKFLEKGEIFGEVVLFGVEYYPVTTICQKSSEIGILSRKKFRSYFLGNPMIGWNMLEVMAQKLYFTQQRIENLAMKDARRRISQALLELSGADNNVVESFNQEEFASYLGVTRETISRNISKMKREGLIKRKGSKLVIKDIESLKEISKFSNKLR